MTVWWLHGNCLATASHLVKTTSSLATKLNGRQQQNKYNLKGWMPQRQNLKNFSLMQGDSGGPLICSVGSDEYLFGILAIGPTNGRMP